MRATAADPNTRLKIEGDRELTSSYIDGKRYIQMNQTLSEIGRDKVEKS